LHLITFTTRQARHWDRSIFRSRARKQIGANQFHVLAIWRHDRTGKPVRKAVAACGHAAARIATADDEALAENVFLAGLEQAMSEGASP
jgi:hypothetical protein